MKHGSIRTQLKKYYLIVGVLTLGLCLAVLLVSAHFLSSYALNVEEMTEFNDFTGHIEDAQHTADYYLQTQSDLYYHDFRDHIADAQSSLTKLQGLLQTASLQRELLDLKEICQTLLSRMDVFHEKVTDYTRGAGGYSCVGTAFEDIQVALSAAAGRFEPIRSGILEEMTVQTRKTRARVRMFLAAFLILACVILLLMIGQIRRISRSITQPIQVLTQAAVAIRENNMDEVPFEAVSMPDESDSELIALADVFNDMLGKVKDRFDTIKENSRIRQELHESRFRELQMQINPHFLFNTLNMAAEKAYLDEADDTAEILENVAAMFRYSLDFSGKSVRLSEELRELGNYIYIQEQRYGDRIRFYFDLDEKHHDVLLPALTLQPLVENSIVHGVGMRTENGRIDIFTEYREETGYLEIGVRDNGDGMSPEKLESVRSQMKNYQGGSVRIGLGNVYLRLSYYYHGKFHMSIDSAPGGGTLVMISLPYEESTQEG